MRTYATKEDVFGDGLAFGYYVIRDDVIVFMRPNGELVKKPCGVDLSGCEDARIESLARDRFILIDDSLLQDADEYVRCEKCASREKEAICR